MEDFIAKVERMTVSEVEMVLRDNIELYSESEIQILCNAYEKKAHNPSEDNALFASDNDKGTALDDLQGEATAGFSAAEYNLIQAAKRVQVTTTDIHRPYEVISPIIYNTTNRGAFSSLYKKLLKKYSCPPYDKLLVFPSLSPQMKLDGLALITLFDLSSGFEGSVGQRYFDNAFYMSVAEIKLRASELGGHAVVGMKMDFDLDTASWGCFYLQMYGTVVRFLDQSDAL